MKKIVAFAIVLFSIFYTKLTHAQKFELDVETYIASFHFEVGSLTKVSEQGDTLIIERVIVSQINFDGEYIMPRILAIDSIYVSGNYIIDALEIDGENILYVFSRRGENKISFVSMYDHVRINKENENSIREWKLYSDVPENVLITQYKKQ